MITHSLLILKPWLQTSTKISVLLMGNMVDRDQYIWEFIPVQTPNYSHFVPSNRHMAPQIATLVSAQQFGPAPI